MSQRVGIAGALRAVPNPGMRTISFGSVQGRFVLMDERSDSYFAIGSELQDDIVEVVENGGLLQPNHRLRSVLEIGDEPARIIRACAPPAETSLVDGRSASRTRIDDILRVAFLIRRTKGQLRSWPIERLLQDVFRPTPRLNSAALLIDRALRFRAARKLVPTKPNCLLDSLSLVRWLGAGEEPVSLLFGVKLDPFAAHCWLQSGALVLNDRTENVSAFTVVRSTGCSDLTR